MASALDEVTATANVRRVRLIIRNRAQFDQLVARIDERWELEVSVRRLVANRSHLQNKYYWGVCVHLVSEHTGYSPEEVHELAKQMFIPKRLSVANGNGEIVGEFVMGGSTRTLTTAEFSEFTERFKQSLGVKTNR